MTEHPNATRVREMFAAFAHADLAAIQATIPEDAVWRFPAAQDEAVTDARDLLVGERRSRCDA